MSPSRSSPPVGMASPRSRAGTGAAQTLSLWRHALLTPEPLAPIWHWLGLAAALAALAGALWQGHQAWRLTLALWVAHVTGQALLMAATRWTQRHRGQQSTGSLTLGGLLLLSLLLGTLAGLLIEAVLNTRVWRQDEALVHGAVILAFCATPMVFSLGSAARQARRLSRLEAERTRLQSELLALQAQMEPHFLFNTLATLRSLVRQQSAQALPLLDHLSNYLDATLHRQRRTDGQLGEEMALVTPFLNIMAQRLGPRLRWSADFPTGWQALPLPPLALQTLVENAIRHGIEPAEDGGTLHIHAQVLATQWTLSVANTGLAPQPNPATAGHGLALDNLRQRLRASHGSDAWFELERQGDTTLARLTLPLCPGNPPETQTAPNPSPAQPPEHP